MVFFLQVQTHDEIKISRHLTTNVFFIDIFRQNQRIAHLAETVVVKLTQSLTNVSGVDPVTSSHCARVVPPNFEN